MSQTKDKNGTEGNFNLTENEVKTYLEKHSDFFSRHPDLIRIFEFAHASGGTASLFEKQVSVLRERNVELRHRIATLTDNARENNEIFNNTRKLIIALLDAKTLKELNEAFSSTMNDAFNVEYSSMIIFGAKKTKRPIRKETFDIASKNIGAILKGKKPVCGALRNTELKFLFPESKEAGSAAVMPLIDNTNIGVIAIGSSDATYYNSDMGTLFLSHIGEVLVRVIPLLIPNQKT